MCRGKKEERKESSVSKNKTITTIPKFLISKRSKIKKEGARRRRDATLPTALLPSAGTSGGGSGVVKLKIIPYVR